MTTISINMKFWHDGHENSTRIRNVKFCWEKLKDLDSYLKNNGVISTVTLYDFSENPIISEAKHISYPKGTYKKAEKTNIILNDQADYDFFMMVDADAFFDDYDYSSVLALIKDLNHGDVVTFDLAKLNDNIASYIKDNKFYRELSDWSYAYSGDKNNGPLASHVGGLGGVYICDTKLLLAIGGFDEKYTGWGGEDGDILNRIWYCSHIHNFKPTKHFAPFHLPHLSDWSNSLYSTRFSE